MPKVQRNPKRRVQEEPAADTPVRILGAALLIFAERGFDAATLREITEAADANIAAVNYHFRSKDELFRHVLETFLGEVNAARVAALERCEAAANGAASTEALADALVRPMVTLSRDARDGRALVRLLLQVRALPRPDTNLIVADQFDPVHERFIAAFGRALPHLGREEIIWRYDFARGAMMQILSDLDPGMRRLASLSASLAQADDETIIRHLVAFVTAGFQAAPVMAPARARPIASRPALARR